MDIKGPLDLRAERGVVILPLHFVDDIVLFILAQMCSNLPVTLLLTRMTMAEWMTPLIGGISFEHKAKAPSICSRSATSHS